MGMRGVPYHGAVARMQAFLMKLASHKPAPALAKACAQTVSLPTPPELTIRASLDIASKEKRGCSSLVAASSAQTVAVLRRLILSPPVTAAMRSPAPISAASFPGVPVTSSLLHAPETTDSKVKFLQAWIAADDGPVGRSQREWGQAGLTGAPPAGMMSDNRAARTHRQARDQGHGGHKRKGSALGKGSRGKAGKDSGWQEEWPRSWHSSGSSSSTWRRVESSWD